MQAVIFVGIPGSGKSTFYQQQFFDTHVRINLDMLRTRHRERVLIDACLAAKQRYVVDNTNVTRADRAGYISHAKAGGFQVVGYYFQSKLGDAMERNRARTAKRVVPDKGVIAKFHRLEIPALGEGFDELYYVSLDGSGGFAVRQWNGGEEETGHADERGKTRMNADDR